MAQYSRRSMPPLRHSPSPGLRKSSALAPLRQTKLNTLKSVLPAEILAMILDYLPISALVRFAQVSRRMQEMVYDDTRWIQKLHAMGCWNESEARRRAEVAARRKRETQLAKGVERRTGGGVDTRISAAQTGTNMFDDVWEEEKHRGSRRSLDHVNDLSNGFEAVTLISDEASGPATSTFSTRESSLDVFNGIKSIRGGARTEYGKIYNVLAPFYLDLSHARNHKDPALFRIYRDPEQQARMLAQLRTFARSDTAPGWRLREETLESIISMFENAALREFEQGYEDRDYQGRMKRYAQVLVMLNGGQSGVEMYVHNHPLMLGKESVGNPVESFQRASTISDHLNHSWMFFERLSQLINDEALKIDTVFPPSVDVFMPFLERVGDDVVSEFITPFFDAARQIELEVYLQLVAGVFEQSLRFAKTLAPAKASEDGFTEKLYSIINRCFEPHVDLYLQDELEFFRNRASAEVSAWEKRLSEQEATQESYLMSNVNRQAAKQDFMTSFRKVLLMPVDAISTQFATTKPSASPVPLSSDLNPSWAKTSPMPTASDTARTIQAPNNELAAKAAVMNSRLEGIASLFSIEVALTLVHLAKQSLERCALFVHLGGQSGDEAKEQCDAIFVSLLQTLGFRHIKPGFDRAVAHLSTYSARDVADSGRGRSRGGHSGVKPLITFLELVNVGDLIQQMITLFYTQELVATHLTDANDFLNTSTKEKKRFEQMLDERVAAGLNKGIDVLVDEVEYICAILQQPTDFNPGSDHQDSHTSLAATVLDISPTHAAQSVLALVESHTNMLNNSADKNTLDVFNQEVGVRLFAALCKHIKRQRVSINGAIRLIADINLYYNYIATFKNKELLQYYKALREMAQIFLIDGNRQKDIATIIADGEKYRGIFRAEEVYEFAQRRADWYVIKQGVEKYMYGIGCVAM